jgi:uncharacterized protein YrrD
MATQNLAEWRGKDLVDRDGEKIGKLEDVYVDTDTDEQLFGTVKEGLFAKHLTFVPLRATTASPDQLQLSVSKKDVKDAPNMDSDGELSRGDEAELFSYYGLEYPSMPTESGRRLARR